MPYIQLSNVLMNCIFPSPCRHFFRSERCVCPSQGIQVGSVQSARRGGTLYVQASPKMPQFKNMTLFVAKC